MPQTTKFPRPDLGDVFVRRNLNGNDEEAMILAVQSKPNGLLWQAVMTTKNGVEFVTGDAEYRNIHDWRPKGWLFDDTTGAWFSPSDKAKQDAERIAAAAAKPEPELKDEFIVADASEIPNALTKKRAGIPLPKVSAPPQV
jgi:hypothetical protein